MLDVSQRSDNDDDIPQSLQIPGQICSKGPTNDGDSGCTSCLAFYGPPSLTRPPFSQVYFGGGAGSERAWLSCWQSLRFRFCGLGVGMAAVACDGVIVRDTKCVRYSNITLTSLSTQRAVTGRSGFSSRSGREMWDLLP